MEVAAHFKHFNSKYILSVHALRFPASCTLHIQVFLFNASTAKVYLCMLPHWDSSEEHGLAPRAGLAPPSWVQDPSFGRTKPPFTFPSLLQSVSASPCSLFMSHPPRSRRRHVSPAPTSSFRLSVACSASALGGPAHLPPSQLSIGCSALAVRSALSTGGHSLVGRWCAMHNLPPDHHFLASVPTTCMARGHSGALPLFVLSRSQRCQVVLSHIERLVGMPDDLHCVHVALATSQFTFRHARFRLLTETPACPLSFLGYKCPPGPNCYESTCSSADATE